MIIVTNLEVKRVLAKLGYPDHEPGTCEIVGIRGAIPAGPNLLKVVPNTPNAFNDTLCVFGSAFGLYRGTVDPGATWTLHPENPQGCAHLVNGRYTYRFGKHKGKPALVQGGPVKVRRDKDRDGQAEPNEPLDEGYFGIDIHLMGNGPEVNDWSAGCQGVVGEQWSRFFEKLEATGQREFYYTLTDYSDWARISAPQGAA